MVGAEGSCQLFFTSLVPWKKLVPIPLSKKKKKKRKKVSANEKHTRGGGEGIGGRGGWSSVMDDRGKGAEMSASLYILALP